MAKNKNRGHRETRKPPHEIPEVPDLGRLSMPRKTNRRAAMDVAAGVLLWDRRRVARAAERRVRRRLVLAPARHLTKDQRQLMLTTMTGWGYDRPSQMFVTDQVTPERLEQLIRTSLVCRSSRCIDTPEGVSPVSGHRRTFSDERVVHAADPNNIRAASFRRNVFRRFPASMRTSYRALDEHSRAEKEPS